jgi:uncharacterized protein YqjF (DUF2071 family)
VNHWLPVHPVAMRTTFRRCFLVNFAVDAAAMRTRLPSHLEPDLHDGRAYLSVVIADMVRMRPAFLPNALGVTYTQVVYRAVVRCGAERGLTFLRSDADNRFMVAAGNAFTFFRFHYALATWSVSDDRVRFRLKSDSKTTADIRADFDTRSAGTALPSTSRFSDLGAASTFLTELYAAFGRKHRDGRIEVVRIERNPWRSRVVPDTSGEYQAMVSGTLFTRAEAELDSVFQVEDLAYHWQRLQFIGPEAAG